MDCGDGDEIMGMGRRKYTGMGWELEIVDGVWVGTIYFTLQCLGLLSLLPSVGR